MQQFIGDNNSGGFSNPGGNKKPSTPSTQKNPGGSPGLITSTGGLFGLNGQLLTPVFNTVSTNSYLLVMDPTNFNCEEYAQYDFPQSIPPKDAPQEGRDVTCNLVILKYREIGIAKFNITITAFQKAIDDFINQSVVVNIPVLPLKGNRKKTFPDNRIHTVRIPFKITGERPQVTISSRGNSGAYSITSLTLCGVADELPQI